MTIGQLLHAPSRSSILVQRGLSQIARLPSSPTFHHEAEVCASYGTVRMRVVLATLDSHARMRKWSVQ